MHYCSRTVYRFSFVTIHFEENAAVFELPLASEMKGITKGIRWQSHPQQRAPGFPGNRELKDKRQTGSTRYAEEGLLQVGIHRQHHVADAHGHDQEH